MRPTNTAYADQQGQIPAKRRIGMTILAENMQWVMDQLTDMYEYPMEATLREIAVNALDTHREAKQTKPVMVTLPDAFDPKFIVQDFGTGLSESDIETYYGSYGASTRRDSDEYTGMMGMGAKAPLAYTKQGWFTVASVKDGVRTVAIIGRDSKTGAGYIDILSTSDTTDPNGTTIEVAIQQSDINEFNRRARKFFQYWDEGTVLVNGQPPDPIDGRLLSDSVVINGVTCKLMLVENQSNVIVQGAVPYTVPGYPRFTNSLPYAWAVVLWVPIGTVQPTPSRDSLVMDSNVNALLREATREASARMQAVAQQEMDAAPDKRAAYKINQKWAPFRPRLTYKGESIPKEIKVPGNENKTWQDELIQVFVYNKSSYKQVRMMAEFNLDNLAKCLFVTGYTNTTVPTSVRRKLDHYMQEQGLGQRLVVLAAVVFGNEWVEFPVVDYDSVIKPIRLTNKSTGGSRPYKVFVPDSMTSRPADYDDLSEFSNPLYVSPTHERDNWRVSRDQLGPIELWPLFDDHDAIVRVARNRWNRAIEDYGGMDVETRLKQLFDEFIDGLTPVQTMLLSYKSQLAELRGLDASKIDDPQLSSLAQEVNQDHSKIKSNWGQIRHINQYSIHHNIVLPDVSDDRLSALDRYPFLRYNDNNEHIYDYLNAIYNHMYKE